MFIRVANDKQINTVAKLANKIWPEHYCHTVGRSQIDYMLEKFQSFDSINKQIKEEGYKYYLLQNKENIIGYFAYKNENNSLFISKLYLINSDRGKGYGKKMLKFIIEQAETNQLSTIYLTVNKHNVSSIGFYLNQGFQIKESITIDIGNNFVMDDYKMEYCL